MYMVPIFHFFKLISVIRDQVVIKIAIMELTYSIDHYDG